MLKKTSILLAFVIFLSVCFVGCDMNATQAFSYSLKEGRYIAETAVSVGDDSISGFSLGLLNGSIMQYVKTDGKSMIKDFTTVNEKFYTVYIANLTLTVNGEEQTFTFAPF